MMQTADGQMVAYAMPPRNAIDTVVQSRAVRHFGKLIGLAAAVAVGMVVVLWTAEPTYVPLSNNMGGRDAAEAADLLTSKNIEFSLDPASGTLLVAQGSLAEARLLLGEQINNASRTGLEMLSEDQGLGTSDFVEKKRYLHALESELVRSVESIHAVRSARVHLAIPRQSIFIRNRVEPSASVVVSLNPGRTLNRGQVEAIVQMVASSIPRLQSSEVKIVDQFSNLLTDTVDEGMGLTTRQFDYTRKLEDAYVDSIINLLQPIVGEGKVNAEVSAQLDFDARESTLRNYDPESTALRSEQISEEENRGLSQALGIPGALSNQPPAGGEIAGDDLAPEAAVTEAPGNQNRSATRNFEVGETITHTQMQIGRVQRLSVAVIVDHKVGTADDGSVTRTPYSDEEIARFDRLIREVIGFDVNRGDSVSVVNAPFIEVEAPVVEEVPAWQALLAEAWVVNLIKQVLGALGVLIAYFVLIRPMLRSLALKEPEPSQQMMAVGPDGMPLAMNAGQMGQPGGDGGVPGIPNLADDPNNPAAMVRRKDATYDQKVDMARELVMDDPARVANVMKQWVASDNG